VLKLLLDEHIAPAVAAGVRRRVPGLTIDALLNWRGGEMLGQDDASCLREAAHEGRTLVTYDRRTIPPLLKTWAEQGAHHGGVIFVDHRTVAPSDVGGLVRALVELCREAAELDWKDRVCFLTRSG
jgi:hypothetical protein